MPAKKYNLSSKKTNLLWCYSDWSDGNVCHRQTSDSVGDLGWCLSRKDENAPTSRQQHSEGQIHTLFDIRLVWRYLQVIHPFQYD